MASKEALEVLDLRLAKGEITPEQYDDLKRRIASREMSEDKGAATSETVVATPSTDPVVVETVDVTQSRWGELFSQGSLLAVVAGPATALTLFFVDLWIPFTSKLETLVRHLPSLLGSYSWLVAYLGAPIVAGLLVAVFVHLRSKDDYFTKPISAEKFASFTPIQRTEIDRDLQNMTRQEVRLLDDRFEYDMGWKYYIWMSGFPGGVTTIILLSILWGIAFLH